MNNLKKFFAASVMVMTVLAMMPAATKAAGSATPGSLIKRADMSTVYYLGADGKRYVFPNEDIYFSWYTDWSGVVTIPATELASYPLGANVVMRAGTKLVKITTDPTVYAVEPNGVLRSIVSEANAASLFGADWAKKVIDVADSYFTNYTIGTPLVAGHYPIGSLVKNSDSANIFYFDGLNYRMIVSEAAMAANGFKMANVMTAPVAVTASGANITGMEAALVKTSQGGVAVGVQVGQGTGLTVALAADTAGASTLIYGQANASLATFNFTASNDGDVKVTSLKVKRIGVSSDALLTAVYLYEGMNRLTDSATVSSNYITFNNPNGLFTVAAGMTKKITVKSNISSTTGNGANVSVAINAASDVVAAGSAVSGSFPLTGNSMSIAQADLATVALNAITNPYSIGGTGTVDAGQSDYTLWKNSATIGTRDVVLSSIRLREIGSVATTDLKDLSFYVDGIKKGSTQQLGTDSYVTFDFSSAPITLTTGGRQLEVRGTIIGGSNKNYSFSLQQATDIVVADSQYSAYVTTTNVPATTDVITVNSGLLTVTKTPDSPTGNVTKDASGVTLGKFEFKASGESMKVEYLKVGFTSATSTIGNLRNGALYANGVQIGSTANLVKDPTGTTFSLGSSLIVTPGTPVIVEVKADMYDNDGTNNVTAGETFVVDLISYASGAQRQSSLGYIAVPSTTVTGGQVTVQIGAIGLSKQTTYGNQNVVVPTTGYKLGAFVLTGNNIEDTTINSFTVDFTGTGTFAVADLSDVYLKYGSDTTMTKPTVNATGNVWSVSKSMGKNAGMVVEIYGNVGSSVTANDYMISKLLVSATTVASSQSVYSNNSSDPLAGQTVTAKTGDIAAALDATTPSSAIIVGNTTQDLAAFKFTTTNDNYTITEIVATTSDATNISQLVLKDGATVIATTPVSGVTATFAGLNIPVSANGSKVLTVAAQLGSVGFGAGNTGANVIITLDSYKANNSQGAESQKTTNVNGNNVYVYKATPTITNQSMPSSLLVAGTQTIAKVAISGNSGTIGWQKIVFAVNKTSIPTIANMSAANGSGSVTLYDDSNTIIPGTMVVTGLSATGTTGTVTFTATNEQLVSGSKVYTLKALIGGAITTGESISTNIANGVAAFIPAAAEGTVAGTSATFVWSDEAGDATTPIHSGTSLDWNNDWLVKNIATDSQTLSK